MYDLQKWFYLYKKKKNQKQIPVHNFVSMRLRNMKE